MVDPSLHNDRWSIFVIFLNSPFTPLTLCLRSKPLLKIIPDFPQAIAQSWADGFAADSVPSPIARFLVDRGAKLSVHAAAGFGFTDILANLLDKNPELVKAKGGDGCTPLHFAHDVATAQLLLDHGADLDARDDDHNSTPAQWRIPQSPELSRFLLDRAQRQISSSPRPLATSILQPS